jgi:hypothetical protein
LPFGGTNGFLISHSRIDGFQDGIAGINPSTPNAFP